MQDGVFYKKTGCMIGYSRKKCGLNLLIFYMTLENIFPENWE